MEKRFAHVMARSPRLHAIADRLLVVNMDGVRGHGLDKVVARLLIVEAALVDWIDDVTRCRVSRRGGCLLVCRRVVGRSCGGRWVDMNVRDVGGGAVAALNARTLDSTSHDEETMLWLEGS